MVIIAHPPVGYRSLRHDSLDGGMSAKSGHDRIKTGIGRTANSNVPVAFHILDEPFGRIVRIGCFINVFLAFLVRVEWADIDKITFTSPTPPYILDDDDVLRLYQVPILIPKE